MRETTRIIIGLCEANNAKINYKANKSEQEDNIQIWNDSYRSIKEKIQELRERAETEVAKKCVEDTAERLERRNAEVQKYFDRGQSLSIKELRTKAGMTQKRFAEYFGVSIKAVQSWEQGERKCPVYLLELMKYKLTKEGIIEKM